MPKPRRPWYVLSNHGLVLILLARLGDLTVPEICQRLGLSRATILNVLRDLRESRMLEVRKAGRRNTYRVRPDVRFRHPLIRDRRVSDLLRAFPKMR